LQYNETMRNWLAALAAVMVAHGCGFGTAARVCTTDEQCHSAVLIDGRCESAGLCSFADTTCDSGRRYGGLAGDQSGDCVGAGTNPLPMIDAAIDTPPPVDAQVCFGTTTLVKICLEAAPTQALVISSKMQIDTGDPTMCARTTSGADNYCVLAGTDINITARLRGVGPKPLVLIASGAITSSAAGEIDVGSHRARGLGEPEAGAGVELAVCNAGTPPDSRGGGAGGSFLGKGGNGGTGAVVGSDGGTAGAAVNDVTALRAGCPGQGGDGGNFPGGKGLGGGAVFLIAGTSITIGGTINAAGEGGGGSAADLSGGGGGGSGGMIGLDAPTVAVTGLLLASGGGGGEGSRENLNGNGGDGADPTTTDPAPGGDRIPHDTATGNGGNGSQAEVAGSGNNGGPGLSGSGGVRGGGGGGGGGTGIIKAPTNATVGLTSPPLAP
jgi:hypothetical protein